MYVDEFSCLIVVKDTGRRGVLSVICTKTLKIDYGAFNTSIVTLKVRLFNKILFKDFRIQKFLLYQYTKAP